MKSLYPGSQNHVEAITRTAQDLAHCVLPQQMWNGIRDILVHIFHDITERREMEQALQLTQFAVDHAVDAAFWVTSEAQFIYVNHKACESLGYDREELLSLTVPDIAPDFATGVWLRHWNDLQQQRALIFESRQRTKDGRILPVEVTANYVQFAGREYSCAFVRDITQRKQAEERERHLREYAGQQDRLAAIGQLATGIAHDFNNILTGILGYAELMRLNPGLPAETHNQAGIIVQQARRAAHLVRQILDFSCRSMAWKRPVEMNHLLAEFFAEPVLQIPRNVTLHLNCQPGEYWLFADEEQMQQMLKNLVSNAQEAMPHGGKLTLELHREIFSSESALPMPDMSVGDWVVITVSDTGAGIPEDVLPHIYEPFFTTKGVGQRSGLGLAQVYGIIKQHDGFIDVVSEVNSGTTFRIYLPPQQSSRRLGCFAN